MKEKETNNTQALSEDDLENVSGGYIIQHGPGENFYGDPGNQIGNYENFGKAQMLTLEEFKKLQEANR